MNAKSQNRKAYAIMAIYFGVVIIIALLTGCNANSRTFLSDTPEKDKSHFQFKKKPNLLTKLKQKP